jgi:hypothetical protein
MGLPGNALFFNTSGKEPFGGTTIDQKGDMKRLEKNINLIKPGLVIIDSLTFATEQDLTRQDDVVKLLKPFAAIAQKPTPRFCLHHTEVRMETFSVVGVLRSSGLSSSLIVRDHLPG